MANSNDTLSRLLAGIGGNSLTSTVDQLSGGGTGESLNGLSTQLDQLRGLFQTQASATKENTDALLKSASSAAPGVATIAQAAKSAGSLGGGFLLSPLLGGLFRLFGRDNKEETPAPLPKFALPPSVNVDASVQPGVETPAATQYDQTGLPRLVQPTPASRITVQVQAMDARSFLDRSDDIARAVKEAMLNSHSVNDVIGEL